MIILFQSAPALVRAYRAEALKFCHHVKPIVERGIKRSEGKIEQLTLQAADPGKLYTTNLLSTLQMEFALLTSRYMFLAFINDQLTRLVQPEEKLIMTVEEYRDEVFWKGRSVN